jgi:hypothetical protein
VLFLGLALPAVWLGLFHSRNWLVKGFAFIVLAWLVEMAPFGLPAAFPRYVLFWFAVGVCLNGNLRNLRDSEIEAAVLSWRTQARPNRPVRRRWRGRNRGIPNAVGPAIPGVMQSQRGAAGSAGSPGQP